MSDDKKPWDEFGPIELVITGIGLLIGFFFFFSLGNSYVGFGAGIVAGLLGLLPSFMVANLIAQFCAGMTGFLLHDVWQREFWGYAAFFGGLAAFLFFIYFTWNL